MMEPANTIIEICGGREAVAKMVGRSQHRVRLWTYPKDRGGTGGLIPAECQEPLLIAAKAKGIALEPRHFFPKAAGAAIDAFRWIDSDKSELGS